MMFRPIAIAVLLASITAVTGAYGQVANQTQQDQKPTEQKQGGEYSGFEQTQKQTEGIPNRQANPTPQAPISNLDVQQKNQTTAAGTTATEPTSTPGIAMIAGIGAVVAVAIVAATWYFRRSKR
jgi:hypothetical protein